MSSTAQLIQTAIATPAPSGSDAALNLELIPFRHFDSNLRQLSRFFLESQSTSHPFQLPEWSTEESGLYCIGRHGGKLRVFARCDVIWPLGKRFDRIFAVTLTRAPVCDDPLLLRAALLQLVDLCRARGFLYLDINPDWTDADADDLAQWLHGQGWFAVGPARASLRLDLRPELERVFASFRKTTRAEIRRAENAGVEVVSAANSASKEHFVRMYLQMAENKAFAPDPGNHMRRVLAWLVDSPGRGVLLTAMWKREILGGVVAVRTGSRCWYVWGATSKGSAVNVGHLMQWHAIQWAREQGCSEYDLGGYRPAVNDGPALFKKGFSQNLVRFLPTYRYPLNSARYSVYKVLTPGLHKAKALLKTFNPSRGHRPENR
jgi:hypothetical protein